MSAISFCWQLRWEINLSMTLKKELPTTSVMICSITRSSWWAPHHILNGGNDAWPFSDSITGTKSAADEWPLLCWYLCFASSVSARLHVLEPFLLSANRFRHCVPDAPAISDFHYIAPDGCRLRHTDPFEVKHCNRVQGHMMGGIFVVLLCSNWIHQGTSPEGEHCWIVLVVPWR